MKMYIWEHEDNTAHVFADSIFEAQFLALEAFSTWRMDFEVNEDAEPVVKEHQYNKTYNPFQAAFDFVMNTNPEIKSLNGEYITVNDCSEYY